MKIPSNMTRREALTWAAKAATLGFLIPKAGLAQLNAPLLGAATRRSAGGSWTPTDEGTNLKFWYDMSLLSGSDGTLISSLTDQSGNGNTLTASGGQRPTLKLSIVNSLNVLRFDGSGNVIFSLVVSYGTATTWNVIAVYSKPSAGGAAANQRIMSAYGTSADFLTGLIVSEPTNATYSPKGVLSAFTSRQIATLGLGNEMGPLGPTGSSYFGGDICEIIGVRGTISNVSGAKTYISNKWGVTIP